jgi:hypothetical protein
MMNEYPNIPTATCIETPSLRPAFVSSSNNQTLIDLSNNTIIFQIVITWINENENPLRWKQIDMQ